MDSIIRELTESDLKQIGNVVNRAMMQGQGARDLPEEDINKKLARNSPENFLKGRENVEYFVAEKAGKLVGIIGLHEQEIRTFYVDPPYQRQGMGRMLYHKILSLAQERKIGELTVRSTIEAQSLYEAWGFTKVRDILKENEISTIEMRKKIK